MKWYAKDLNNIADQSLVIDEETGKNIAVAYDKKDMDLIAAAPELLEALKSIPNHVLDCKHTYPHTKACFCCMVKAAIAKAEGK